MNDTLTMLRSVVESAQTPLEKATALNNLINALKNEHGFNEAMPLVNEALQLAESAGTSAEARLQVARAQWLHSLVLRYHGNYTEALNSAHNSLRYYEQLGESEYQAHLHNTIGNIQGHLGQNVESLQSYYRALELHEAIDNHRGIQMSLGNIGTLFTALDDPERGVEYFERALALAEKMGNIEDVACHLANIGNVHRKLGEYQRALEYFHRSLTIFEKTENRRNIAALLGNLGTVCFYCREYNDALKYLKNALFVAEELEDSYAIALWRSNLGELYSTVGWEDYNLDNAEEYLLGALALGDKLGAFVDIYHIHKSLSTVYKLQERWKDALVHVEKFNELKDEYQSIQTIQSVAEHDAKRKIAIISKEKEITDAKNAELERANQLKTKLLGIAAHDLKNPLGNIIGLVNMLLAETPSKSEHHELLMMINESAANMQGLIIDLLESSAAELGAMTLNRTTTDVAEIIRAVIYSNIAAAQAKQQRIESTIENVTLIADEKRLRQVLENLISNAVKYSPIGKTITVRLLQTPNYARIEVQDEGQGLIQDDMSKLFGQFQRLSAQPTGGESATGLGLSIAKQIVELHGGKIWAESEGKNKGATFIVELPLLAEQPTKP